MKRGERTGPYEAAGFEFWVQDCTIWYDSDGNGTVDTNESWEDFKNNPDHNQAVKNAVEIQLDALGCATP